MAEPAPPPELVQAAALGAFTGPWPHLRDQLVSRLAMVVRRQLEEDAGCGRVAHAAARAELDARLVFVLAVLQEAPAAPFTLQRLAELALYPRRCYSSAAKLLAAIDRVGGRADRVARPSASPAARRRTCGRCPFSPPTSAQLVHVSSAIAPLAPRAFAALHGGAVAELRSRGQVLSFDASRDRPPSRSAGGVDRSATPVVPSEPAAAASSPSATDGMPVIGDGGASDGGAATSPHFTADVGSAMRQLVVPVGSVAAMPSAAHVEPAGGAVAAADASGGWIGGAVGGGGGGGGGAVQPAGDGSMPPHSPAPAAAAAASAMASIATAGLAMVPEWSRRRDRAAAAVAPGTMPTPLLAIAMMDEDDAAVMAGATAAAGPSHASTPAAGAPVGWAAAAGTEAAAHTAKAIAQAGIASGSDWAGSDDHGGNLRATPGHEAGSTAAATAAPLAAPSQPTRHDHEWSPVQVGGWGEGEGEGESGGAASRLPSTLVGAGSAASGSATTTHAALSTTTLNALQLLAEEYDDDADDG